MLQTSRSMHLVIGEHLLNGSSAETGMHWSDKQNIDLRGELDHTIKEINVNIRRGKES